MEFRRITQDNFLIYATKMYDNPHCVSVDEFNDDLRRFSSIKRLLLRLTRNDDKVNLRMLLNHIMIITNVFGNFPAVRLLYVYCPEETYSFLTSIFAFLSILPKEIPEVDLSSIALNAPIINKLKEL